METIYLSLRAQVAVSTLFMKSLVPGCRETPELQDYHRTKDIVYLIQYAQLFLQNTEKRTVG